MQFKSGRRVASLAAVTALTVTGLGLASGTASAATGVDSNSAHGVEITGWHTSDENPWVSARLCNYQSSANSFYFWIRDTAGHYVTSPGHVTPVLAPGQCDYVSGEGYGSTPIQVYARSGSSWTFGTDPIYLG
ncbi:hypothetical protein BX285_6706 [Streptomyces sp. 1114.5]|uniref:hypothetical protein n=1 Tax=unclassified Streptomyces TaxID=2593676 RepID=UPI000BD03317|nr:MULTISPECIES: hypothetical protein [unclassified Streptomyces]RKT09611.1 hypothetical protein BX285_6706 [Streptomyces sp. 1114.5]SOB89068.1 hypothetical protein SAMN06272789_7402 [Streptomyces sp. 1331.2]